jgi:regulator of ribonuclease activity A
MGLDPSSRPTADVLDELGELAQVCAAPLRPFGGATMIAGRVATVRCHEDNVLLKATLSRPGDRKVLVVDGGGSLARALVGDLVAGLALDNGWVGLIVYGAVRDAAALRDLDVGIWALGTTPRASAKAGGGETDVPVSFGGATFRPGDVVYADDDGIVVIPDPTPARP